MGLLVVQVLQPVLELAQERIGLRKLARRGSRQEVPRREQRQMVVAAAQAENMLVVPEGGSLFNMDMSMVQDGNATIEHNVPGSTFYQDVLQMWSQTKTN